jgi:hypothetical protein
VLPSKKIEKQAIGKQKAKQPLILPADKDYFAFLSHKKKNSKLGSATEGLALRVGDTHRIAHIIDYCNCR